MSLNLVSEQFTVGKWPESSGPVCHSWSTDRAPPRLRRSLFSVELSRILGFWEDSIIKDGSYNIDQGRRRARRQRRKNGLCLRRSDQQTGAGAERPGGADHCARHRQWQSADPRRRRASCPVHQHRPAAEYDPGREAGYSAPGRQSRPGGGPAGAGGFSQPERGV